MHNFGTDAVMQVRVAGQILAEVSHPAAAAEFNSASLITLEPVQASISEIDNAVKLPKLHQIVTARGIFAR